jgi:4-hydroxybenzoate polyprenyltransferase
MKGDTKMKLTPPKVITWWIAVILGVLGLLGHFGTIAALSPYAFWLVTAGLVLLVLATLVRDL